MDEIDIEDQHRYITEFQINPVEIGFLCEKYPAVKNSWNQFLTIVELCRENNDNSPS